MLKLYFHPYSTFTRRVHIYLLERSIEHEQVFVDMARLHHKKKDYLALNPYGRLPLIDHDGFLLYESASIISYLEDLHGKSSLAGEGARNAALVDMHVRLCDTEFALPATPLFFMKRFFDKDKWDTDKFKPALKGIKKHLRILDKELADSEWLVGGQFSLAEVAYTPFLEFLPLLEIDVPVNVDNWWQRIQKRPSVEKTRPSK